MVRECSSSRMLALLGLDGGLSFENVGPHVLMVLFTQCKGGFLFENGGPYVLTVLFTQCSGGLLFENVGP